MADRRIAGTASVAEIGRAAPDYRAPTSKGHTLVPDTFRSRLPVILHFGGDSGDDALGSLWAFDALLPEFGARRVQLLGVVHATAREVRDRWQDQSLTVLADEDGSIRAAYGGAHAPFSVVIDRNGDVVAVTEAENGSTHAQEVLAMVDALRADRPDAMSARPHAGGPDGDERDDRHDDDRDEPAGDPISPLPGPDLPDD